MASQGISIGAATVHQSAIDDRHLHEWGIDLLFILVRIIKFWRPILGVSGFPRPIMSNELVLMDACPAKGGFERAAKLCQTGFAADSKLSPY